MRHMNAAFSTRVLISAGAMVLVLAVTPMSFNLSDMTVAFAKGGEDGSTKATALVDAAPSSRVDRIAAYIDAVGRTNELTARAITLEEKIVQLNEERLSDEERAALERQLDTDPSEEKRAALEADAEIRVRIKAKTEELGAIDAEIEEASQAEAEALEAAANRAVADKLFVVVNDKSTATDGTDTAVPTDTSQVTQ